MALNYRQHCLFSYARRNRQFVRVATITAGIAGSIIRLILILGSFAPWLSFGA
jgi:hypothetical protein